MAKFFIGHLPDVLHHGTTTPEDLDGPCMSAAESLKSPRSKWGHIPWRIYDRYFEEARLAYANIVWEGLGLRQPGRPDAPDWARNIRSMQQLSEMVGILFVTDDAARAGELYGPTVEIDMTHPSILDAIVDPNTGTHNAWILVIKAGEPLPKLQPAPSFAP